MARRKPRPERTWQRVEGAEKPAWVDFDLDEQSVEVGDYLVWPKDAPHIIIMHDWQFAETYR